MSQTENFANNAASTLNGAINNSTTSVTVVDGTPFPAGGFRIIIESEIMYCLTRSGNGLTVVRGVENTTAASHADTLDVVHIVTAGSISALKNDMLAMLGQGRTPSTGNTYGDEFDDDNFSGWTAVNSGSAPTATVTEKDKFCSILHPGGGSAGQFLSWMKNVGTRSNGDWISVCYREHHFLDGYPQLGIWFADGATYGSGVQAGFFYSPRETTYIMRGETNFNNQTIFVGATAGYSVDQNVSVNAQDTHLKLMYKGSNQFDAWMSIDGVSWQKVSSNVNPCTITPSYVGFGYTTWGGNYPAVASLRSFRTSF